MNNAENSGYGIKEWVADGIAAGILFLQVRWMAPAYGGAPAPAACRTDRAAFKVKILYRAFPNQQWNDCEMFEDVTRGDLHFIRMRIVESDRKWQEHNRRLAEAFEKTLGGV